MADIAEYAAYTADNITPFAVYALTLMTPLASCRLLPVSHCHISFISRLRAIDYYAMVHDVYCLILP